jgi:hypothetical protein
MEWVRYSPTPDSVPPTGPWDRERTSAPSGAFHVVDDEPQAVDVIGAACAESSNDIVNEAARASSRHTRPGRFIAAAIPVSTKREVSKGVVIGRSPSGYRLGKEPDAPPPIFYYT